MAWMKQALIERACDASYFSYAVPPDPFYDASNEWSVSNSWNALKGSVEKSRTHPPKKIQLILGM